MSSEWTEEEIRLTKDIYPSYSNADLSEIKDDNRIENLELMKRGEHTIKHNTGRKMSEESKAKLRETKRRKYELSCITG